MDIEPRRTVGALLRDAVRRLDSAGVASARLDARLLVAEVLGITKTQVHLSPEREVDEPERRRLEVLLTERCRRRPLAQVLGHAEFWSLEFEVTGATLTPRPETEDLVERGARFLRESGGELALDVGTGTGCIPIALATEVRAARVHATDLSGAALAVAGRNAVRHGVADRITFHQGDLCAPLAACVAPGSVDLALSNPPYVARAEAGEVDPEVLWEPALAIFADGSPARVYARVAASAAPFVRGGGRLLLELPGTRQEAVLAALRARTDWTEVGVHDDLAGLPRVWEGERLPPNPRSPSGQDTRN